MKFIQALIEPIKRIIKFVSNKADLSAVAMFAFSVAFVLVPTLWIGFLFSYSFWSLPLAITWILYSMHVITLWLGED